MSVLHVLVVDDEPAIRQVLTSHIRKAGHDVEHVGDGSSAVALLSRGDIDVCICDIRLPDFDGVEVMRRTRSAGIETSFLMMTAYASIETAVEAMKLGAFDYFTKPLRHEDVLHRLQQISDMTGLREENRRLRTIVDQDSRTYFLGESPAMKEVERLADKMARTAGTVLITGESGTGKSFIARRIHEQSPRSDETFISINCGAIPENLLESEFFGHIKGAFTGADQAKKGLFREADGGTLFLDEAFELPLALQVKLLHVLEEKEVRPVGGEQARRVDVRILAATNRDPEKMVAEGTFRQDLYYRLNVLHIKLPPLRERTEDLSSLIRFFLQREADRLELDSDFTIDPAAEDMLTAHPWPGNLREMQNVIARSLVLTDGDEVCVADLPRLVSEPVTHSHYGDEGIVGGTGTLREQVRRLELKLIRQAVVEAHGDRQVAAKSLGVGLSTLYRKLDESGE